MDNQFGVSRRRRGVLTMRFDTCNWERHATESQPKRSRQTEISLGVVEHAGIFRIRISDNGQTLHTGWSQPERTG